MPTSLRCAWLPFPPFPHPFWSLDSIPVADLCFLYVCVAMDELVELWLRSSLLCTTRRWQSSCSSIKFPDDRASTSSRPSPDQLRPCQEHRRAVMSLAAHPQPHHAPPSAIKFSTTSSSVAPVSPIVFLGSSLRQALCP
jgi:hypothetical protein